MKYQVGDKVIIHKDLAEYHTSDIWVTSSMVKLAGQTVTIEYVHDSGLYYRVEENDYFWAEDMLEPVEDALEELLNKLESEIEENKSKSHKANEMVNSGKLDPSQNDLLTAQIEGYRTVNKIIKARINLIKIQLTNKEEQENKSNDEKETTAPFEKEYCYQLINGDDYSFVNFDTKSSKWSLSNTDAFNGAYKVSFTDKEIKDSPFDSSKFRKVSV